MKEVRLGIVGIGNMGSAHAAGIYAGRVKGLKLTAVCDCNEKRLAWARENLPGLSGYYPEFAQMLDAGGIDAVLIATPHSLHPVFAIQALERGLHVLTEMPAGIDTASVRLMNAAAEKSGRVFGIMYNQRTNPLFAALREGMKAGKLGEMKRMVWIITNWYRSQAYYDSGEWRGSWNGEGGGVLLNQCPHNLDLWQWICGMPVKLKAECRIGRYHDIDVEDDVSILAEYENGAQAVFLTSTGEFPGTNRLEISGTRGKAVIENGSLTWYLLEQDERDVRNSTKAGFPKIPFTKEVVTQTEPESAHCGILQNFTDVILEREEEEACARGGEPGQADNSADCRPRRKAGAQLLAPGIEGINGLTLSNAAYLSADRGGEWVDLPVDEEAFRELLERKRSEERIREKELSGEVLSGTYSERWKVNW